MDKFYFALGLLFGNWFSWWLMMPLLERRSITSSDCWRGLITGILAGAIAVPLVYLWERYAGM